ncbi:MAG: hypothetical protein QG635_1182 [Bacteroidota bacterium]|nr:hypothetical protein [Bacteroidota bacterium]
MERPIPPPIPYIHQRDTVTLTVGAIVSNAFSIGFSNFWNIAGATILYLITIWIPYLNIGTSIAMSSGIIISLSKGDMFKPTDIFKPGYRKFMGEYFILSGLIVIGVYMGLALVVIPGIVLGLAWSLSCIILIDKDVTPLEALKLSNKMTDGFKWTLFGATIIIVLIFGAIAALGFFLIQNVSPVSFAVAAGIISIVYCVVFYGASAYIYRTLHNRLEPAEEDTE